MRFNEHTRDTDRDRSARQHRHELALPAGGGTLAARLLHADQGRADAGRLDWRGLLLLSPGIAGIVFGLSQTESQGGFGHPLVYGPMIAGIALGPIVFGMLAPETHAWLFAHDKLAALEGLSQVGLVLFMFIVGAELRVSGRARESLTAASWVGTLGVLLAVAVHPSRPGRVHGPGPARLAG